MEDNMFGWDANGGEMTWTSGHEIPFTKTPANVPASYIQSTETPTAATNKKRKPTTATGPTRKTRIPPSKRIRRPAARKPAFSRAIPRSLEECDHADKTLISMRDSGADWKAIRERWEELTREKTAVSTLPNRYARLKSNFIVIGEEDNARLMIAKRQVEEAFEAQKWDAVARVVEEKGGDSYTGVVLKRQYQKLMLARGLEPPLGIRDDDFEVEGDEDESDADADADIEDEE